MSNGKTHDRFSLGVGSVSIITLFLWGVAPLYILSFFVGWLFATLIFSPDTDILPRKNLKIIKLLLFPYSIFFKHRGLSHGIITGTISRLIYLMIVFTIIIFITHKMGYLNFGVESFLTYTHSYISNFDLSQPAYRYPTWFLIGHFLADLCHILLDRISTFFRRLF